MCTYPGQWQQPINMFHYTQLKYNSSYGEDIFSTYLKKESEQKIEITFLSAALEVRNSFYFSI